ncbi:solute carrier family 23 protein [Sabulicella rubraurantiaca]|uniref:solute carrier family 23 protein n=1 Tax=Sabulicella rubraurantiaca TaxID=2811429 RepID=UPI001A9665EC|nr:solute carrier family 23 protein [Sabulicella rubraurantiaca]
MSFDRSRDKRRTRPEGVIFSLDEVAPPGASLGLATQHIAVQAIYLVLPVVAATAFGLDARGAANFISLALLGCVVLQVSQALTRGPIGAGYQMPSIPTPVMLGAVLLAAGAGLSPAQAGALLLVAGGFAIAATFLIPRPQALVPTEIAGVVVFLLGASLLPVMLDVLHVIGRPFDTEIPWDILITFLSFAVMGAVALRGQRLAPYGMLIGAACGIAMSALGGLLEPDSAATLAANPWFAWPEPVAPRFDGLSIGLVLAFVFAVFPAKATILGNLVAFQRASDGSWERPDGPPLRRGLLAHGVALAASGAMGAMAPGPSSACVGLSIANRTLSLRIVWVGAALLLLLALSPKLVALFILIPPPVKAAMLLYVACFMIATGCQLITVRMLDIRRSLVVGLGLVMGFAVLTAPATFREYLPALASALTFGALAAFVLHLATLPLVAREARFALKLDEGMHREVEDRATALGGAWGARRDTMVRVQDFLVELGELLASRGLAEAQVTARGMEGSVSVTVSHPGVTLPKPTARPNIADLEGSEEAKAAFALWLATRQAARVRQSPGEIRVAFPD